MSEYYEIGKKALETDDFETASENFKFAMEEGVKGADDMYRDTYAKHGEAINKLGDQLFKKKEYKEAMNYYIKSVAIMQELGKSKREKNFTSELNKAIEKLAQEINNKGDTLYKEKKFREAVEVYKESVLLMMEAKNQKKIDNFQKELVKALTKLCDELISQAATLSKQESIDNAMAILKEAKEKAKITKDERLIQKIEKEALNIYERVADTINNKGDAMFKSKNFTEAINFYRQSVVLIKKSGNERKEKAYKKELVRAFKENAEEINAVGDKAFKEGDYETAISIYRESVEAAEAAEDEKLIANFTKELEKSFEKYAQKINNQGDKLYNDKEYEKAARTYLHSLELAESSKKFKLIKNFTKELKKTYIKWAEELSNNGEDLFKKKEYEKAMPKYEESLKLITTTGEEKMIIKYKSNLVGAFTKWAKEVNNEGDAAYKMKEYEKAYGFYQKSVEVAEKSGNPKLVNKFRKERDKALKKLS